MTRTELEHIIRASGAITGEYEFVIVGSQSILGSIAHPGAEFMVSMEADIYPMNAPDLADLIDGAIGEGSQFHDTHGYYAQGVGPETAILPALWRERVCRVQNANTEWRVGYCLDVTDLFLSKAAAGRTKDREFCQGLLRCGYVAWPQVTEWVATMPLDAARQRALRATIRRWAREAGVAP